jgi:hypothetical protein
LESPRLGSKGELPVAYSPVLAIPGLIRVENPRYDVGPALR